ncbi:MAG TPA: hypothetical protein VIV58_09275 [Kofleriaceae bacterium]
MLLATLVACGAEDPRQPTVEVISLEILAPACGAPQCHSTSTNQSGYAFDTLAAAKVSLRKLVGGGGRDHSLIGVITATGGKRMPPDAPLDPQDIALIQTWVNNGAKGL